MTREEVARRFVIMFNGDVDLAGKRKRAAEQQQAQEIAYRRNVIALNVDSESIERAKRWLHRRGLSYR